jgi:tetratricopeptide (TPR) repeat protein
LDNVFGVEGEVAGKIASALKARLSPAETARLASDLSSNDAASDLFLRAEYHTSQGELDYDTASYKAAIPLYRQAILHDRNFALAFARLSYAESALAWYGGGGGDANQLAAQARSDATRAIQLAPKLAAAQLALGYSDYWGRADYAGALKAFAAALTLKPDDPDALSAQGYALRRQGRFKDALASLQRAFTLDPRNSVLASAIGATYAFIHRYPDSRNWCERALALDPHNDYAKLCVSESILLAEADVPEALAAAAGDDPALKLQRVRLLTLQGKYQEALTLLDGVPDTPDNFMVANVFNIHGTKALQQAELYRLLGQVASARPLYTQALPKVRAQLVRQHGINRAFAWADLATAQMGLGQIAQALQSIAKSQAIADRSDDRVNVSELVYASAALYAEAHRPDLAVPLLDNALTSPGIGVAYSPVLLWLDPAWNPIRNDPGFQALLKKYARYTPASASSVAVPTASTGAP